MTAYIKPCWHCGSYDTYSAAHRNTVLCRKCFARGPVAISEAAAIAAWNTRANTPDSAAQTAMGDELNVVWLTGILERLDEHRLTGPATLAATLFQEIEKYLPKVAQPSDTTAQLITDEQIDTKWFSVSKNARHASIIDIRAFARALLAKKG